MNGAPLTCRWKDGGAEFGGAITHPLESPGCRSLVVPAELRDPAVLQITLPITRVGGIWFPYVDRGTLQKVGWNGRLVGTPFFQPGLIAFVDSNLRNRLLLLTEPSSQEVVITWALDQAAACYRIEIDFGRRQDAQPSAVHFSTAPVPVHQLVSEMVGQAVSPAGDSPTECYEPSFCTWYAWHGALDQGSVERCARLARDLGFGTWIMDDGWQYDADQRVESMLSLGSWHRFTGDYQPSKRKFADFGDHVRRVKDMGLRYLLWVAPMLVGVESQAFRRFETKLLPSWLNEGFRVVDPRDAETTEHVISSIERLSRDYPLDGFKVDYDYAAMGPGQIPHGVGPAYGGFVRQLIARLQKIRPAVEWNLPPNVFARTATHAFRCCDVPFDPDSNRMFMANLRMLTGRAALYSDPALWSVEDPLTVVHRNLVPSLFCVPSVGAPLLDLPGEHLEALRGWLAFYRTHQKVLNHGDFHADWAAGDFQSFSIALERRRIAAAFSPYPFSFVGSGETLLINASDGGFLNIELERQGGVGVEDARGRRLAGEKVVPSGLQRVDCPSGGVLKLRSDPD